MIKKNLPWLASAFVCMALPFLVFFLVQAFPLLRHYAIFASGPEPLFNYSAFPFQGLDRTLLIFTSIAFWLSWIKLHPMKESKNSRRYVFAEYCLFWSCGSLLFIFPLIAVYFSMALNHAVFQDVFQWRNWQANHGPWRYIWTLRTFFCYLLVLPVFAWILAVLSWILKPAKKSAVAALAAIPVFCGVIYFFSWLVD